MSEAGLKAAMGVAMNRYNERGKIAELMRSQREGRMMEYLYPELKKQGYDREVLRKLGHELDLEDYQSAAESSGKRILNEINSYIDLHVFSRHMTLGRKVRRYTKNAKKKCDFFVQLMF